MKPKPKKRRNIRVVIGRPSARINHTTINDPLVIRLADRLAKSLSGFTPEYTTTRRNSGTSGE